MSRVNVAVGGLPVLGVSPADPSDEGLEADVRELHRALGELVRVYQFRDRDRICCYDISVSQCYALEAVILNEPLSVNDLSARLYLDKSGASRLVDALERKGYVERRESLVDRRAVELTATRSGRELYARVDADLLADERRLLAGFPAEVRSSMARLVGQLSRAAAARIHSSGGSCCVVD